jgi:hypothetical protein
MLLLLAVPAAAQVPPPSSTTDRLFLGFAFDATLIDHQWWEGDLIYSDGDLVSSIVILGTGAVRVADRVEVGGDIGFGNTDTPSGLPDGNGATDLNLYGKYYFGDTGKTEFAAGVQATVPSGDNTAGLGTDQWGLGGFGSLRYSFSRVTFAGQLGFRLNSDAEFLLSPSLDGETSFSALAAAIFPFSDDLSLVGELFWESKRFEGGESDTQFLVGLNWGVSTRGKVRAAVDFGLSDGAPDFEALIGYAFHF